MYCVAKEIDPTELDFAANLNTLIDEHDTRLNNKLICRAREDKRQKLARNSIMLLLQALQRSKLLLAGFIASLESSNILMAALAARAHFETTAILAFFHKHLRRYYSGEATIDELDDKVFQLSLGGRTIPSRDEIPDAPNAVNILTCIDVSTNTGSKFRKTFNLPKT